MVHAGGLDQIHTLAVGPVCSWQTRGLLIVLADVTSV